MLYFISGLPRSGSTLLCNILAQRDDSLVTPTSPLINIVKTIRDNWRQLHLSQPQFDRDSSLERVINSIMLSYHTSGKGKIIFDKNRGWPSVIEAVEKSLGKKIKIVATSRDIRQVAASMEKMWRRNIGTGRVPAQLSSDPEMSTTNGRIFRWLKNNDVIGSSIAILGDAFNRGLGDRIHIVDYENLTNDPSEELRKIEDFLCINRFNYDFNNVPQLTIEDDEWHGYSGLHTIRPVVEKNKDDSREIIGEAMYNDLSGFEYQWNH